MDLIGRVVDGCGRAAPAQRSKACRPKVDAWARAAGFCPVPGTLNVELDSPDFPHLIIPARGTIWFRGEGIQALIVREREGARGGPILELLAPVILRDALQLINGDQVTVEVFPVRPPFG